MILYIYIIYKELRIIYLHMFPSPFKQLFSNYPLVNFQKNHGGIMEIKFRPSKLHLPPTLPRIQDAFVVPHSPMTVRQIHPDPGPKRGGPGGGNL